MRQKRAPEDPARVVQSANVLQMSQVLEGERGVHAAAIRAGGANAGSFRGPGPAQIEAILSRAPAKHAKCEKTRVHLCCLEVEEPQEYFPMPLAPSVVRPESVGSFWKKTSPFEASPRSRARSRIAARRESSGSPRPRVIRKERKTTNSTNHTNLFSPHFRAGLRLEGRELGVGCRGERFANHLNEDQQVGRMERLATLLESAEAASGLLAAQSESSSSIYVSFWARLSAGITRSRPRMKMNRRTSGPTCASHWLRAKAIPSE